MTAAEAALLAAYRQLDGDRQEELVAWARYLADHYPADDTGAPVPIERGRRNDDDE